MSGSAFENPHETDAMFPRLEGAQIERLKPFTSQRHFQTGEILFDQGDESHRVFIVLKRKYRDLEDLERGRNRNQSAGPWPGAALWSAAAPAKRALYWRSIGVHSVTSCRGTPPLANSFSGFAMSRAYLIANSINDAAPIGSSYSHGIRVSLL